MILLPKSRLKMMFFFQRWDVLVPWRVPVARREKTVVSFFRAKCDGIRSQNPNQPFNALNFTNNFRKTPGEDFATALDFE